MFDFLKIWRCDHQFVFVQNFINKNTGILSSRWKCQHCEGYTEKTGQSLVGADFKKHLLQ